MNEKELDKEHCTQGFVSLIHTMLEYFSISEIQQLVNDEIGSGDKETTF